MSDGKATSDLLVEYHQKIEEFLKFDELNLKDSQFTLASVRHYWVGRLMFHKQQIAKLKKIRQQAAKTIKQKLEDESPLSLSIKTINESVNSNDTVLKIEEEIINHELLVEYLTKVESNLRDAQYGMNNLVKIITLETT
jgi:hypothetical protein